MTGRQLDRKPRAWHVLLLAGLCALAGSCAAAHPTESLTERRLADIATVAIPADLEAEDQVAVIAVAARDQIRDDMQQRLAFGYSATYCWASMGSIPIYRQQLLVSLMPPDAADADYAAVPRRMAISYDQRGGQRSRGPWALAR